jgi:hypothetical protein
LSLSIPCCFTTFPAVNDRRRLSAEAGDFASTHAAPEDVAEIVAEFSRLGVRAAYVIAQNWPIAICL